MANRNDKVQAFVWACGQGDSNREGTASAVCTVEIPHSGAVKAAKEYDGEGTGPIAEAVKAQGYSPATGHGVRLAYTSGARRDIWADAD